MGGRVALSASLESYLEAISLILAEKQAVRAKDIAQRLGVNNSSVTVALRSLAGKGLVNYAPYDVITLTAEGQRVSEDVIQRHKALRDFFVKVLLIDEELSDRAACEMEHALPREILVPLTEFVGFVERCPQCLEEFHHEESRKKAGR
ncbi:MAG: metal-dependent transcriptional regulator [Deltaproteobacteria bacterium]|nr:metal-dependent transcriptional regulator [Deltaproteobacteria bacterium]MBW2122709.1 metal-dependent transcriptional regulator [Deltaproteobacteria bacterium]